MNDSKLPMRRPASLASTETYRPLSAPQYPVRNVLFPALFLKAQNRAWSHFVDYLDLQTKALVAERQRTDEFLNLARSLHTLERLPEILEEDDLDWAHGRELKALRRKRELADARRDTGKSEYIERAYRETEDDRLDIRKRGLKRRELEDTAEQVAAEQEIEKARAEERGQRRLDTDAESESMIAGLESAANDFLKTQIIEPYGSLDAAPADLQAAYHHFLTWVAREKASLSIKRSNR